MERDAAKTLLKKLEEFKTTFEPKYHQPISLQLRREFDAMIRIVRRLVDRKAKVKSAAS